MENKREPSDKGLKLLGIVAQVAGTIFVVLVVTLLVIVVFDIVEHGGCQHVETYQHENVRVEVYECPTPEP